MLTSIWRVLLKAGWAPVAVLLFHQVIAGTAYRQSLDFLMHSLGGASMAFFFFCAIGGLPVLVGTPTLPARYFFSFTTACTVGVFWEFGELASDVVLHTHIQQNLHETMGDLIADATGATVALALIWGVVQGLRTPRDASV